MTARRFRIACAQYDVGFFSAWGAYERKIEGWFARGVEGGGELLVFPEYCSMELASLFGPDVYGSLSEQLAALQTVLPDFLALFERLAVGHGVHVVAGSFPVRVGDGYRNRSHLIRPDGSRAAQDKLQMTRFERERWLITCGDELDVLATAWGPIGIAICYDSEFPLIARRQAEAGADLIVVPSCTDTLAGYHRVRIGAQARALENQCYVAHASLVGDAPWSEAVDRNVGAAGVYTPIDVGFPDDGVLARGVLSEPGWVFADLDLDAIARVRAEGDVFNHRDWPLHVRFS